jgi:hypothetical protein
MIVRELLSRIRAVSGGGGIEAGEGDDQDGEGDQGFHDRVSFSVC